MRVHTGAGRDRMTLLLTCRRGLCGFPPGGSSFVLGATDVAGDWTVHEVDSSSDCPVGLEHALVTPSPIRIVQNGLGVTACLMGLNTIPEARYEEHQALAWGLEQNRSVILDTGPCCVLGGIPGPTLYRYRYQLSATLADGDDTALAQETWTAFPTDQPPSAPATCTKAAHVTLTRVITSCRADADCVKVDACLRCDTSIGTFPFVRPSGTCRPIPGCQ